MKKLTKEKTDYSRIIKYYKRKLVDYGVMKEIKLGKLEKTKFTKKATQKV